MLALVQYAAKKAAFLAALFVIVLSFNFNIDQAFATSGACSYHGGVDCSAGPDYDGSVICNDGWTDSSVSYDSMSECTPALGLCGVPITECPENQSTIDSFIQSASGLMSQYQTLKTNLNASCIAMSARSGGLGSSNSCSTTQFDLQIKGCQDMITYENTCSDQLKKSQAQAKDTACKLQLGGNSIYDARSSGCACAPGFFLNAGKTSCVPPPICKDDVSYLGTTGTCVCRYGTGSTGECQTRLEKCASDIGDHNDCKLSPSGDPIMGCVKGYKITPFGKCAIDGTAPNPAPAATTQSTQQAIVAAPQILKSIVSTPSSTDFQVLDSDIQSMLSTGTIKSSATFRKCPSTSCTVIRYFAKGSVVNIIGKYKKGDWYEVAGTTGAGGTGIKINGWVTSSLFSRMTAK